MTVGQQALRDALAEADCGEYITQIDFESNRVVAFCETDEGLALADGGRVTGQFSDRPAARLAADGRVSLPGGAGLLLTLER